MTRRKQHVWGWIQLWSIQQLCWGPHIRLGAVLRHEGHSEVGAEEGSRQPASSFSSTQLLPHHNGPLQHALAWQKKEDAGRQRFYWGSGWRERSTWVTVGLCKESGGLNALRSSTCPSIQRLGYITGRILSVRKFSGVTGSGCNKHLKTTTPHILQLLLMMAISHVIDISYK